MPPTPKPESDRAFSFGPFRLFDAKKQLLEDGVPVRLGSRALELLMALVERSGEVLSRQELEARVWPRTVVEETSLRVHIAALRKALRDGNNGARYITNIPGRGYSFVAPVEAIREPSRPAAPIAVQANQAPNNLPSRLTAVVGRKDITRMLAEHLRRRRLVSLVGPGGIGKTTVALAVASEHFGSYEHGAAFVDLAPLSDPALILSALGFAIGYQSAAELTLTELCEFLRDRQMLLVLDNCEHVLGAAAHLVESVLRIAPRIRILTTTREPLFAEGELVHHLSALVTPATAESLTHEQAMAYSAIGLFVERAEANSDSFVLSDETLPAVVQLCQRLDGIPLAIELAAARVGSMGVVGLAQRLDDLFELLNRGRRTAMPRHQTLEALLDWSFKLLNKTEQVVLGRLSVFRASFSLDSAAKVAASPDIPLSTVVECVLSLVVKSLITAEVADGRFRLLYMTRAYAARRLVETGELPALQRRHAAHHVELGEATARRWGTMSPVDRFRSYSRLIDDHRAAMDWTFAADGDDALGVELTVAVWLPAWGTGLFNEYSARVERALEVVVRLSPPQPDLELKVCVAWCFLSGQSLGMGGEFQAKIIGRALELAEQTGDIERHAEVLYAVCVGSLGQARYDVVARLAEKIKSLAESASQSLSVVLGDRLLALAFHNLGSHARARVLAQRVIEFPVEPRHGWFIGQVPRAVSMGILEARILWLEGFGDRAVIAAKQTVQHAIGEHPFALSQAIALAAIPIAMWRGDHVQAREWIDALAHHTVRYSLPFWQSWADSYRQVLDHYTGNAIEVGTESLHRWTNNPGELDMLATLSAELLTPETIARVSDAQVGWCGPEILRAEGENLLRSNGTAASRKAVALFKRGLTMAREQGALAWELRLATSLASLWRESRREEAHALLLHVASRFTEGLETADLVSARKLLSELAPHPVITETAVRA